MIREWELRNGILIVGSQKVNPEATLAECSNVLMSPSKIHETRYGSLKSTIPHYRKTELFIRVKGANPAAKVNHVADTS